MTATQSEGGAARPFSDRVVVLFTTQVITAIAGIFNGFVLARLLGPDGKGDYYLLTLLPTTAMVILQLGLPQAFGYYAARGETRGLWARSLVLTAALSLPVVAGALVLLRILGTTVMANLDPGLIAFALLAMPLALNATFTTGIVLGRQATRLYAAVSLGQTFAYTLLMLVIVAMLGGGVPGAILVYVATTALQAAGLLVIAARVLRRTVATGTASARVLFRYGIPSYPGVVTQYFGYRADVFLLAALLPNPSAALGYYSMGVSMAEMVFFFPNAVSTLLFPHVAGSTRDDADRQVAVVSRVTLLVTALFGLAIAPVGWFLITVLLPAFTPALPALYLLLPGVVFLSVTKVLTGYLSGLGRPGLTSAISISAFVLNVVANVLLIPRFGIYGAATASLLSYTASSIAFTIIAARVARTPLLSFWIPTLADLRQTGAIALDLLRRSFQRFAGRVASGR